MKDLASTAIETKPNRTTKKNQQTRTANLEAKKKISSEAFAVVGALKGRGGGIPGRWKRFKGP